MKIALVRHGQTDWNREEVFRGRVDIALNDVGIRQAEAVALRFKGMELEAIYSSPLKRALQTAKIIASLHNMKVEVDQNLSDMHFGDWQGLSLKEVKEKEGYADLYKIWYDTPHLFKPPGGESLDEVMARASASLEKISKHTGVVCIISHRVVIKLLLLLALGLDSSSFWRIKQDPCGISIIEHEGGKFILTLLNDTCHLRDVQDAGVTDF